MRKRWQTLDGCMRTGWAFSKTILRQCSGIKEPSIMEMYIPVGILDGYMNLVTECRRTYKRLETGTQKVWRRAMSRARGTPAPWHTTTLNACEISEFISIDPCVLRRCIVNQVMGLPRASTVALKP